ncbi:MAG: hypothetical protein D6772_05940 [Bacteroidetes bacterium]|nr:MAG: hypothetical protein D6772_05940 [Bacteroidota bacterium]
MSKPLFIVYLAALALLGACNQFDELENVARSTYEAEYALPLVNTQFSMTDVLENFEENSVLSVLPNGLLRLQYSGDVITQSADDVFEAINQTLAQTGIIPLDVARRALPFSLPDGLDVDRMDLKAGQVRFGIENCYPFPVTATITFPDVRLDGQPLVIRRNLAAAGEDCTSLSNIFTPISLANYVITPEQDSIYVEYEIVDADGNPQALSGDNFVLIDELAFSYAEGYLGQIVHSNGRDTIEIDFFDKWIRGQVYFEDPTITFNFDNSFGIPTRSIIDRFDIFTVNGDVLPLESPFVENGVDFPYPTLDEVGEVKSTAFVFNRENSNIREVLGAGPIAIDYDVDASTNPDGDTNIRGFVTDSSYYVVRVDVDLPLYGYALDFGVRDTIAVDFTGLDNVNTAEFKMVTENAMPVGISIQGYFLDANGTLLDSLFEASTPVIAGAPVDATGRPNGVNETTTFSDFPAERYQKIQTATEIALVATFATTLAEDANSVQVLANQNVKVRLGAIFGVSER